MKKRLNKLLALMIAAVMIALTFTVSSAAFGEEEEFDESMFLIDGVYYSATYFDEDGMHAEVIGYEIDDEGNSLLAEKVVIPSEVEYNGERFTVSTIANTAFMDCYTLREITLPSTITVIDNGAFAGASSLGKIVIPDDCYFEYLGYSVFDGTRVLDYLSEKSPDGEIVIGQNVLLAYLGSETDYTVPDEITIIADMCFFGSGIENITIPETVDFIGQYAFASCFGLKEITVPDSVAAIEEGTFSYCMNLETLNLGDNIEYIGLRALEGTKVKSVYIGKNVYDVLGAFAGCNTIENITVSSENEHYSTDGKALYYKYDFDDEYDESPVYALEYYIIGSDADEFTVPENVSEIGNYAFYNCKQIKKVNLTSNVEIYEYSFAYCTFDSFDFSNVYYIGNNAFEGCENIKSADLSNAYYINDSAFENCTALSDVVFGDSLSWIGMAAFRNTALTEVNVGGDFTFVDEGAFQNCSDLKRVSFNDGVYALGEYLFMGCPSLERVYIAESVEEFYENAFFECEDTVFEVIKYSAGYDFVRENNLNYEIVGKVSFFKRVAAFFARIFDFLFGWLTPISVF
ncbi:MAG: leucine-rich repeat domain-containing protein [Acutalibacteraceae bacterium]